MLKIKKININYKNYKIILMSILLIINQNIFAQNNHNNHNNHNLTEQDVYNYRVIMKSVGKDFSENQSQSAFNKLLPLANQGFAEAQYILATLYQDGDGTEKNFNLARYWYLQAINNDNPEVAKLAKDGLESILESQ